MNAAFEASLARGLASLRRMASRAPAAERCELCGTDLGNEHQHLADPRNRRILCACYACAILFDGTTAARYRRIPADVRELFGLEIDDAFWSGLSIPVGLVFFFRSSASGMVLAVYPSPAGPTETTIDEEDWRALAALHPALEAMRADVEALLVNRVRGAREFFIIPIDESYKLAGLVRQHWRGFSGGDEAWEQIRMYFDDLKRRSVAEEVGGRA